MRRSQKRLALLWWSLAGVLIVWAIAQSTIGTQFAQDGQLERLWGWLLPTVMPTLLLISGALAAGAVGNEPEEQLVDPFFYRATMVLSAVYLLSVFAVILAKHDTHEALWLMEKSGIWLGPSQGLVSGFMGVFFVKGAPAAG